MFVFDSHTHNFRNHLLFLALGFAWDAGVSVRCADLEHLPSRGHLHRLLPLFTIGRQNQPPPPPICDRCITCAPSARSARIAAYHCGGDDAATRADLAVGLMLDSSNVSGKSPAEV